MREFKEASILQASLDKILPPWSVLMPPRILHTPQSKAHRHPTMSFYPPCIDVRATTRTEDDGIVSDILVYYGT